MTSAQNESARVGRCRLIVLVPLVLFVAVVLLFLIRLYAGDPSRIPSALIGPKSAGAEDGVIASARSSSSEAAPAAATRPDHAKPAARTRAASRRNRWVLDTPSIIAESLKNP